MYFCGLEHEKKDTNRIDVSDRIPALTVQNAGTIRI